MSMDVLVTSLISFVIAVATTIGNRVIDRLSFRKSAKIPMDICFPEDVDMDFARSKVDAIVDSALNHRASKTINVYFENEEGVKRLVSTTVVKNGEIVGYSYMDKKKK